MKTKLTMITISGKTIFVNMPVDERGKIVLARSSLHKVFGPFKDQQVIVIGR